MKTVVNLGSGVERVYWFPGLRLKLGFGLRAVRLNHALIVMEMGLMYVC